MDRSRDGISFDSKDKLGAHENTLQRGLDSRFKPAEIMFKDDKAILVRKRDEFSDLLRNQIL